MDILEQKRRIITTAIIAVVLTGILIAAIVSAPLIKQIHTNASQAAGSVADAKAENMRALFALHQDIARQTSSRSELARVLAEQANGGLSASDVKAYSEPRLQDAAEGIENLAALVRYNALGEEVVRIGPMADALPATIPVARSTDIRMFQLANDSISQPLLSASYPVRYQGEVVGMDQLLFTLESLESVFQADEDTRVCLIDSDKTKRLVLNPATRALELVPPDGCLTPDGYVTTDEQPEFFRSTTDDGTRVLAFVRQVEGTNWELHMHSKISRVFGDVVRDITLSVLAILLLSGLAGLVVWRSLRPVLHALVSQASQIAKSTEELRLAYQVFEHTHEAIVISDTSLNIIRANPAFSEATGKSVKALKGACVLEFLETSQSLDLLSQDIHRQLIAENAWQGEVWLKAQGGNPVPNLLTISPVRNERGQIHQLIQTFSNISERVKAEKQMIRLAHFDRLTGLPNRTALDNHLDQSIQRARRDDSHFALMFLDLDKFKPVNDTYGHQAGDELLRIVAQRLKHCIRSGDVVGRRGGDEFVIITGPLQGEDNARHIAEKVVQVLNETFHVQNVNLQIGASVGVALYPDNGVTAEDLLKKADAAMYKVKSSGRNNMAFA
ncbi:diguanylate cyclase [Marinobacter sp. SS5-14b]|uniref:diguanylate cyclase domain-containing protein n=1 Tax=Marinobacter sp. SS5-14b TaxID=3050456 RepID=UPI0026E04920|nr:diguanylate cyclase [Marinobacter sp. SS5-14b]